MFMLVLYNGISSNSFLAHKYSPIVAIVTDDIISTTHHCHSNGNFMYIVHIII